MAIAMFEVSERLTLSQVVARNVRALMAVRAVTQMQLADVLGLSQTGISNRLRGKTPFDVNELGAIASAFNVAPGDLVKVDRWWGGEGLPQLDSNQQPAGYTVSSWAEWGAAA